MPPNSSTASVSGPVGSSTLIVTGTVRNAAAAKAIGDNTPRLVAQACQQELEETFGCRGIAPVLHQDVEHDTMLIDGPPKVVQPTTNTQISHRGVKCRRLRPAAPELAGKLGPEPVAPLSDTLVRDEDTAFGKIGRAHV